MTGVGRAWARRRHRSRMALRRWLGLVVAARQSGTGHGGVHAVQIGAPTQFPAASAMARATTRTTARER